MTATKLPQLADGSRWDIDGKVADKDGDMVACVNYLTCGGVLEVNTESGTASCFAKDAIAVIRRAGLDTEYDALRLAAKELMLAFDEFTRETHDCSECEEADFVGEHIRIDDVIDCVRKLEALL